MIKKIFLSLGIVLLLSFTSCGDGSSEEAKEVLQKILQFVGIPQNIVANICQDENGDGICGSGELFTKLTIHKGDTVDDIWQKISLTPDGRYFLSTYNPHLPILVEFEDIGKVNYDDNKFTLEFKGFETNENDNETKEVSILQSMVDANALSTIEANNFRTLNNEIAQERYYEVLLSSLETNINTLRANQLDKRTAMTATIIEMADETKSNQEQANRINNCGYNQSCIDEEIGIIGDELVITQDEVQEILDKQNGSVVPEVTPTPTPIAGGEEQYGKWVKPSQSICDNNGGIYNNDIGECQAYWENINPICSASDARVPTIDALKQSIADCGGDFNSDNTGNASYQACYKENGFSDGFYFYWSSTSASDASSVWVVYFYQGIYYTINKNQYEESIVRCIRN